MMPMKWEDYLEMPEEEVPSLPLPIFTTDQEELKSFRSAIDKLNLPSRINASKLPLTSFDATNRFHMTQIIDLSGYLHYVTNPLMVGFLQSPFPRVSFENCRYESLACHQPSQKWHR
jgi:hypothetical protein